MKQQFSVLVLHCSFVTVIPKTRFRRQIFPSVHVNGDLRIGVRVLSSERAYFENVTLQT